MKLSLKNRRTTEVVRNHRRHIQVLIIPDDQAEPRHFRLSIRKLKFLRIVAIMVVIHAVVGLLAYFQLVRTLNHNSELVAVNNQLVENSKKVYELVALFQQLEATDVKLRSALGLDDNRQSLSLESNDITLPPPRTRDYGTLSDGSRENVRPTAVDLRDKLGFLQQAVDIGIHDYLKSVPTFLPVEGVLTRAYSNNEESHYGIDIAAPRGSSVRAAGDGVVVFAGWTPDLGNMLIVYHGNGFFTYYGHNQRNLMLRNSVVRKGDTIALLGSSGQSSAPHLHFELWKDGIPLNPADYILAFSRM